MADSAILHAPLTEQTVKTLHDGEKGGGQVDDVTENTTVKRIEEAIKDGKENKEVRPDESERKSNEMQVDESSPCSSANVSLNNESPSEPATNNNTVSHKDGSGKKRRRHNRHKGGKNHRKPWKPYSKLTWDEKKKLDDKETIRATKKRNELFASGLPMAPYNTTQFLMEDQDQPSPVATPQDVADKSSHTDNDTSPKTDGASASYGEASSEAENESEMENEFLAKEFDEEYENYHAERLQKLSKYDLVKEYIELESKHEELKRKLKEIEKHQDRTPEDGVVIKKAKLEKELEQLTQENKKLSRENKFLKVAAGKMSV